MRPFPSDRIAMAAKAKQEPCVWKQDRKGLFGKFFYAGCSEPGIWYATQKICQCGKKVEVKK